MRSGVHQHGEAVSIASAGYFGAKVSLGDRARDEITRHELVQTMAGGAGLGQLTHELERSPDGR